MRKRTKVWLAIAAILIVVGLLMMAVIFQVNWWDMNKLSTVSYETNSYELSENIDSIYVRSDRADVVFYRSADENTYVVCHEESNCKHSVEVENGVLKVELIGERGILDKIEIVADEPGISIYLPEKAYKSAAISCATGDIKMQSSFSFTDVDINLTTGDVALSGLSAGEITLSLTTGDVNLSDISCEGDMDMSVTSGETTLRRVKCANFTSLGNTGDVEMVSVLADKTMQVKRTSGDIQLEDCDGADIYLQTTTGDVEGSLRSAKIFNAQTTSGDIDLPRSSFGGSCEIKSTTGDIEIEIHN